MSTGTLVPKRIVDKNGKQTTVNVSPDKNSAVSTARVGGASVTPPIIPLGYTSSGLVLEVNESAPFPQANDLSKVGAVVDLIHGGATTAESLSVGVESNSASSRAGNFYGDAAVYLGLAEKVTDEITEYALTADGLEFLAMSPEDRQEVLADSINDMDMVQIYRDHGEDELKKHLELQYGYADSTIERRASCISSWSNQALDNDLGNNIGSSIDSGMSRSSEALEIVARQKREAREAAVAAREPVMEFCTVCFMNKSVSGECAC